ncbi:hydroxymethylbilane synthase [Devosia algicola]|uniref:Porphobilinogen deaminase n=1 Tax=Devosia algicola TaxID=3026418 RepID=A0ABY7YKY3_9HYPH|nr:hydroxymethylbilane synthase [Devosia algicola]WDR01734.1 hydroxymethylbilane synthase [Devosia algicola]
MTILQSLVPLVRIGTRGSPLAMMQARLVAKLLRQHHGLSETEIAVLPISTGGDRSQKSNASLSEIGGKGLFTKEIDAAMLGGQIDIAVHSSKDVATVLPEGIVMPVYLEREDARDAFISLRFRTVQELPRGAKFGTSSIRRAAQVLRLRPDLEIVPFRGNVDTRLQKLADGVADATMLAVSGLNRLEKMDRITAILDVENFMPAPAQGAIGIATRHGDAKAQDLIAPLNHAPTHSAIIAERAMLAVLDGSCRTPVGAWSQLENDQIELRGEILSLDGQQHFAAQASGPVDAAETLGAALGQRLLQSAGTAFVAQWASAP